VRKTLAKPRDQAMARAMQIGRTEEEQKVPKTKQTITRVN